MDSYRCEMGEARDAWDGVRVSRGGELKKKCGVLSQSYACHPCAGAMLSSFKEDSGADGVSEPCQRYFAVRL